MGQCCCVDPTDTITLEKISPESKTEAPSISDGSDFYVDVELKEASEVCDILASKLSESKVLDLNIESTPITISNTTNSKAAVQILLTNKIRAAPVIDHRNKGEFIGVLDLRDTLKFALDTYISKSSRKLSSASIVSTFELRTFETVHNNDSLLNAAQILANGAHIVGVLDDNDKRLIGIITQSMLFQYAASVKWNDANNNCLLQEILDLGYITSPIKTIKYDIRAFDAFECMNKMHLSGLAVVDDDGILIHNTSSTDIKLWMLSNVSLEDPIEEFLINVRKQPALTDKYPITYCTLQQTLKRAMKKLLATKYHRLWIVDKNNIPIGVLALTDIFRFICKTKESP